MSMMMNMSDLWWSVFYFHFWTTPFAFLCEFTVTLDHSKRTAFKIFEEWTITTLRSLKVVGFRSAHQVPLDLRNRGSASNSYGSPEISVLLNTNMESTRHAPAYSVRCQLIHHVCLSKGLKTLSWTRATLLNSLQKSRIIKRHPRTLEQSMDLVYIWSVIRAPWPHIDPMSCGL